MKQEIKMLAVGFLCAGLAVACGERGPQGLPGTDGAAGKDGETVVGPIGPQGPAGKDAFATIEMNAAKLHGVPGGSVFDCDHVSYKGNILVPEEMHITQGYGSNDSCAASLIIDGDVECCYSPKSTVNKPGQSGNRNQMIASLTYEFLQCSNGAKVDEVIQVYDSLLLCLNKADASESRTGIKVRVYERGF